MQQLFSSVKTNNSDNNNSVAVALLFFCFFSLGVWDPSSVTDLTFSIVLFGLVFCLRLLRFSSKSVFVTKSARFNLAVKFSAVSLLNFRVVIYLS